MQTFFLISVMAMIQLMDAQESCGVVRGECRFNADTTQTCTLTLHPSDWFLQNQNMVIRWLRDVDGKYIMLTENVSSRYEIRHKVLTIQNASARDDGIYNADCYVQGTSTLRQAKIWNLKTLKTLTSTIKTTTTTAEPIIGSSDSGERPSESSEGTQAPPIDNSSVIVVAMSSVVIVVIIAGTVIVVVRRRQPPDGKGKLMSNEDTTTVQIRSDRDSGVYDEYNEIGYVSLNADIVIDSEKSPDRDTECGDSPSLPKRPDKGRQKLQKQDSASTSRAPENHYSVIRDSSSIRRGTLCKATNVKNHAQTGDDRNSFISDTDKPTSLSVSDEYSKVIPKSQRSQSVQPNSQDNGPEYAKVIPKSKRRASEDGLLNAANAEKSSKKGDDKKGKKGFSVKFPKINSEKLTKTLPNDTHMRKEISTDGPTYSNITKQKRQSRAKSKELQYAVLDHVNVDTEQIHDAHSTEELEGKVQYASIDFERKAFVAPIRKAPSSWYKRKQKKKNKTKE